MNIGLLGFGAMGKTHTYSVKNLPFFYGAGYENDKIVALASGHYENAVKAVNEFSLGRACKSEDEIINDPNIDIVDICTPNIYHYETVKKALNNGKHVYCEKPLAVTYDEAKELCDLAESKGLTCRIVFNNRFMPAVMRAKEIVESGRLGNVITFRVAYLHASCIDPNKKAGWKQDRDICGGGVLFDLGSHAIDLVRHLCGEIASVSGRSQIYHKNRLGVDGKAWETNADEAFYITAELENGGMGTIEANKLAIGTNDDLSFEIYGEKGALKYSLMQPNYLRYYDGERAGGILGGDGGFTDIECVGRYPAPGGIFPSYKAPVGWLMGHVESYRDFLDAIKKGSVSKPDFKDGARVQLIMEKAYESADNGSVSIRV